MFEPFVMNIDVPVVVEGFLACVQLIERLSRERFHGNYDGRHGEKKRERGSEQLLLYQRFSHFLSRQEEKESGERERERKENGWS